MLLSNILPISAFNDNYIWVIVDAKENVFDCIDPGDALPIIDYAKSSGLILRHILLTHHHADHIGGVAELINAFPACTVYGPKDARIPLIHKTVKAHDILKLGNHAYHVLSNPGHTSTHISYYEPLQGWLFCGDTLFSAGCGRVFDGTIEQLHNSLLMFKQLHPSTLVFCAHEYTRQNIKFAQTVEPNNQALNDYANQLSTQSQHCTLPSSIRTERLINPFLRTDSPDIMKYALHNGAPNSSSMEVFKTLRDKKNLF